MRGARAQTSRTMPETNVRSREMEVDSPEQSTSAGPPTRLAASWDSLQPLSSKFLVQKIAKVDRPGASTGSSAANAFRNQYASVYFSRLMALKKTVKTNADLRWKDVVKKNPQSGKSSRVLDIKPGSLCVVVGTVYMEMRLKPNILEDIAREQYVAIPPPRPKFVSDDDEVMLEDESGRVRLVGRIIEERKFPLVTGIIAAVLGAENQSGDFEVADMCFAGLPPQPHMATPDNDDVAGENAEVNSDPYVVLASGLNLGTHEDASDYRLGLLQEWLTGEAASEEDDASPRSNQIVKLVLAGNSMATPVKPALEPAVTGSDKKPRKTYGYDSSTYSSAPTVQLDSFLAEVLPSLDVVLMSGESDPTGTTLPQQSLHEALLPRAGVFEGFKRVTNPAWFQIADKTFLGSSGQNIDDIFKYTESENRLDMACSTLEWSHMAPTAPDTLFCYPFQDRDPFILTRTPHVYFVGNQPQFETRLVESERDDKIQARVILVPKFSETGQVVLLNCRTLSAIPVQFA